LNELDYLFYILFLFKFKKLTEIANEHYDNQNIHRVLDLLVELIQLANLFFQQREPWKIKSRDKIDSVLFITFETVRLTAIYLQPVTPDFADKLLSMY
jgi:methionyl-tRNA synthetase